MEDDSSGLENRRWPQTVNFGIQPSKGSSSNKKPKPQDDFKHMQTEVGQSIH